MAERRAVAQKKREEGKGNQFRLTFSHDQRRNFLSVTHSARAKKTLDGNSERGQKKAPQQGAPSVVPAAAMTETC